jgi:ankyrin repeat protein
MKHEIICLFWENICCNYPFLANIRDKKGETLLMYFSKKKDGLRYIKKSYKLEKWIDINAQNDEGWSALMYATIYAKLYKTVEVVKYLLEKGAAPELKNKYGGSAIMYSCIHNDYCEVLQLLYEYGCSLDEQCGDGWTPLMAALYSWQEHKSTTKIIDFILKHKENINIDIQCNEGWSALMYAIEYTNNNITNKILKLDPRLDIKNADGMTAISINREKTKRRLKNVSFASSFLEN